MISSVYIHIPFCEHLCTYCDFAKRFYDDNLATKYLDALEKETEEKYQKEEIKTIYIGGGTPSCLSLSNLHKLKKIIRKFRLSNEYEFTFEVNPENITFEKLFLLKDMGVNRISMGVESTNNRFLEYLGRHHDFNYVQEKIQMLKENGISNINVDLIYAIKNENMDDLKADLDNLMKLDIDHISTYSLEIHDNTMLKIKKEKYIEEELDNEMYYYICDYLTKNGFEHYEISNFCKNKKYSKHNLVYWKNKEYYGFGLGASGYFNNIRYTNTRSMNNYLNGLYLKEEEKLTLLDQMSYELILGFRLINGINVQDFEKKYQKDILDMFNIRDLIKKGYLIFDGENIKVCYNMLYIENQILENFVQ